MFDEVRFSAILYVEKAVRCTGYCSCAPVRAAQSNALLSAKNGRSEHMNGSETELTLA